MKNHPNQEFMEALSQKRNDQQLQGNTLLVLWLYQVMEKLFQLPIQHFMNRMMRHVTQK